MTRVNEDFDSGCAWVDGAYIPIAEARIPLLDTGFSRSDCTYDVAAVWQGRFFRLDDHLDRLVRGCGLLRLPLPVTREQMREVMVETVRRCGLRDAYVEIIVTRGVPPQGERDPRRVTPRIYAYAIPYVWVVGPEAQEAGAADVVVARNTRRTPIGSVDPTVKNFQWGDLVRGLFEAYDRQSSLAILTDGDGFVTEGAGFNVFAVVDQVLVTPERGVLQGITRRTAIEIAQETEIPVRIGDVPAGDLYRASEIFLTSTAGGVMAVSTLDGMVVGKGAAGPVTRLIRSRYWELHTDPRFSFEVSYPEASA